MPDFLLLETGDRLLFETGSSRLLLETSTAGIAFDAASNSTYKSGASTYSWTHVCTGDNRFLSVDVSMFSVPGTTVTGITYNGIALSIIGSRSTLSGAGRVECWGLSSPASGSHTIEVTLSASIASAGTAVSYTGVHQSSPTEAVNTNQGTNGVSATDATVVITSTTDNAWPHAAIAVDDTAITANQTSRNNVTGALGSGADEDFGPHTPAGAKTMGYTDVAGLATWAIAGYAIRPATEVFDPSSGFLSTYSAIIMADHPLLVISY